MSRSSANAGRPVIAIYIGRDDGDFDFVAAFDGELDNCDQFVEDLKEWLLHNGEEVLVKHFDDASKLVDVLVSPGGKYKVDRDGDHNWKYLLADELNRAAEAVYNSDIELDDRSVICGLLDRIAQFEEIHFVSSSVTSCSK